MKRTSDEAKRRGEAGSEREPDRASGERIEITPEEVIQKDPRPWRRITLEGVVARTIATSAVALGVLALLSLAVLKVLRII